MLHHGLADFVLGLHVVFVLFVALGGLLVLRKPALAWAHVPAVAWGVLIELANITCPLTPLETAFRQRAGEAGYDGGFIDHFVAALLYPPGLTRAAQIGLGAAALVFNLILYGRLIARRRRARVARA